MPVTLITGPIGSGKTSALMARFSEAQARDAGLLIAPTEAAAAALRQRWAISGGESALLGHRIIGWGRFVQLLADAQDYLLTPLQQALFLFPILGDHPLRYFRRDRPSMGIASQFASTIALLHRNGITPARLRTLLETRGSLKENDLLTVYERYAEALTHSHLLDEGCLLPLALKHVQRAEASLLQQIDTILFDEFIRFEPGAVELIDAIKTAVPKANIAIALTTSTEEKTLEGKLYEKTRATLEPIADRSESLPPRPAPAIDISVHSIRSPRQEARFIAHVLEGECKDAASTIVLAVRGDTPFVSLLLPELDEHSLATDLPTGSTALASPLVHRLLSEETLEKWPAQARLIEYAQLCAAFVRDSNVLEASNAELATHADERRAIARTLAAASTIEQTLAECTLTERLIDLPAVSRECFVGLLLKAFTHDHASPATLTRHLPFELASFEAGLAGDTDVVMIPNLVEGTIPRVQTERLFFSDADRLSPDPDPIIDALLPNTEELLAMEAHAFATFCAKCKKRLVLTSAVVNENGAETAPSSFLDRMPEGIPEPPIAPQPSASLAPDWGAIMAQRIAIERARAGTSDAHSSFRGMIEENEAKALLRQRFTESRFSPTSLERYAGCPFQFFVEKVLGLKPLEEELPELQPKDRGTIVHRLLERFYQECTEAIARARIDRAQEEGLKEKLNAILIEVEVEHAALVDAQAPGLKSFSREAILNMAWQVVQAELGEAREISQPLEPAAFEWTFGKTPETALAVPVENDAPALVRGQVDRIDIDANTSAFLVVDYKTGASITSKKKDILEGRHLQLPLYVEAIRQFLYPSALPLGGLLIGVMEATKVHGFVRKSFNNIHYAIGRYASAVDDETWDEMMHATLAFVGTYAAGIRGGAFSAAPAKGCPRHCDYKDICRYAGHVVH